MTFKQRAKYWYRKRKKYLKKYLKTYKPKKKYNKKKQYLERKSNLKNLKIRAIRYYLKKKENHKKWYIKNKIRLHYQNKKKYCLLKKELDRLDKKILQRKLSTNIRIRILKALKRNTKKSNSIKLLGCSVEFARKYLQKQFKKGMTWKNYGRGKYKWVIDHIKPCRDFDLSKKSEQHKCFHYTNLQPLWWYENLSKR